MSAIYILLFAVFNVLGLFLIAHEIKTEIKSAFKKLHNEREVSIRVTTAELSDLIQKARSAGGINAKISNNDGSIVNMLVAVRDEKPKVIVK